MRPEYKMLYNESYTTINRVRFPASIHKVRRPKPIKIIRHLCSSLNTPSGITWTPNLPQAGECFQLHQHVATCSVYCHDCTMWFTIMHHHTTLNDPLPNMKNKHCTDMYIGEAIIILSQLWESVLRSNISLIRLGPAYQLALRKKGLATRETTYQHR